MKTILTIAVLLAAGNAQAQTDVWSMQNLHSASCSVVSITSGTPVEMTGNLANGAAGKVYYFALFNTSTSADIFCNGDSAITANVGQTHSGIPIMRASSSTAQPNFIGWLLSINQAWYCITNNAGGAITVSACPYK